MVAPLLEALLLRALRRGSADEPAHRPTRLVSGVRRVDTVGYVAERTTVLLLRPGSKVEVLPAGSLVLPRVLGRGAPAYVVVSHDPVDVWLRVGPFETLEGRSVQQVELQLTVAVGDSPSGLEELAGSSDLSVDGGGLGATLLDGLSREVTARTTEAVRRRTLGDLTSLSLGVLLDGALPTTFLGGLVTRTSLEVTDVDWPTEGRGWRTALAPGGAGGGR